MAAQQQQPTATEEVTTPISSIDGKVVYDTNANKIGVVKQVGIDSTQSMVLVIIQNDGTEATIQWNSIRKIGEVVLLGDKQTPEESNAERQEESKKESEHAGKCNNCSFNNKEDAKFCEECGTKLHG